MSKRVLALFSLSFLTLAACSSTADVINDEADVVEDTMVEETEGIVEEEVLLEDEVVVEEDADAAALDAEVDAEAEVPVVE